MNQLSHLPEDKQKDIAEILEVIKDVAKPEKVILFGSFARGDWVDDIYVENGVTYTYKSDFDFLVVTNGLRLEEYEVRSRISNRTAKFDHPVNPSVHELDHINYGLERGQYFFKDIIEEGIVLYDTDNFHFSDARPLSIAEQREEAEYYYEKWVESGSRMLDHTMLVFRNSLEKGYKLNEVMFLVHQTAEKLYAGFGLVFTGYKPKTHSIKEYRNHVKNISKEIDRLFCFPPGDNEQNRLFNILQKSYIDARYKDDYQIDRIDLESLLSKTEQLEHLVVRICREKIESLI